MAAGPQFHHPPTHSPLEEFQSDVCFWAKTILESADAKHSFVDRVVHCKCRKGKQHEFLLVHAQCPSQGVTLLGVDRSLRPSDHASSAPRTTLCMASSSRLPAKDRIIVSVDGTEHSVMKYFGPCNQLRTLVFPEHAPKPTLAQFSVLLLAAIRDDYQLYKRSCYWFAGVTWEALRSLFPHSIVCSHRKVFHRLSTCWGVVIPQDYGTQEIVRRYEGLWQEFIQNISQEEERRRQEEGRIYAQGLEEGIQRCLEKIQKKEEQIRRLEMEIDRLGR